VVVNSLLSAIVRADGDALVMHVGERPYVVAALGPVELSSRVLTIEAVTGMMNQLMPVEARQALDELGAVEHELPRSLSTTADRFTVVAARGGDDIWIEIRRHRVAEPVPSVEHAPVATPAPRPIPAPPSRPEPAAAAKSEPAKEPRPAFAAPQAPPPAAQPPTPAVEPEAEAEAEAETELEPSPAVVLPLARNHVRQEPPPRPAVSARIAGLDRLLRLAAARGATALYVMAQARPAIRVDGEIAVLDGEPELGASEVEALIMDLAPERTRQALKSGEGTEWVSDVDSVGRVRCLSIRDHRGPGGIFRLIAARAVTAEQLGLSKEIQGLLAEPEGLVLVAGPRASGKSTLVCAFVDLINRSRSDYVITLESQVKFVHESRSSLVSQREVRGDAAEMAAVARAALRENPDVLVIEDLRSLEVVTVALEAVEAGHLVIGAVSAHTSATALGHLIEQLPPDRRPKAQATLAEGLRGVVAQVLLRKTGGGRVAARELLLNTPSVASLIAEGRIAQIPLAIDSGRKHGMVPLNDALVAFVQGGIVDAREAFRKAYERQAFLSVLRREGLDTSFVERLA
jgi:twitching motility protein PilT